MNDTNNDDSNQGMKDHTTNYYLLIQRGKEPNKGMWSLPGGSIQLGETTLSGAQRELIEEVKFVNYQVKNYNNNDDDGRDSPKMRATTSITKREPIAQLTWHPQPFITSDAIVFDDTDGTTDDDDSDNEANDETTTTSTTANTIANATQNEKRRITMKKDSKVVLFHYLIAQCFAKLNIINEISNGDKEQQQQQPAPPESIQEQQPPKVLPDDDADDAKWFTLKEIQHMSMTARAISPGVDTVIERAELLQSNGLLETMTADFT